MELSTESDASTRIGELKRLIQAFCEARDWDQFHGPKDLAIGVITEAAELVEHFRFRTEEDCRSLLRSDASRKEICDELADVFFFVLRFAQMHEIDLTTSLKSKMEANAIRYPVEKAKGSNRKYDEFEE